MWWKNRKNEIEREERDIVDNTSYTMYKRAEITQKIIGDQFSVQ